MLLYSPLLPPVEVLLVLVLLPLLVLLWWSQLRLLWLLVDDDMLLKRCDFLLYGKQVLIFVSKLASHKSVLNMYECLGFSVIP